MKSLAIWYEKSENKDNFNQELELHINFWKLPGSNRFKRYLDFGLKVENPEFVKKIFIFIPITINENELVDVGKIIADHKSLLLTAIFNEDYKITFKEKTPYLEVRNANDSRQFWLTILKKIKASGRKNKHSDPIFYVSSEEDGSIITIELPKRTEKGAIYLRIRINSDELTSLSHVFIPNDSLFHSALKKVELFDFRINSKRHLPNTILNRMVDANLFHFKKINFFFICDSNEDILLTQKQFIRTRVLESNLWDKYLKFPIGEKHKLLAYQWKVIDKENSNITDFSLLIKSQFKHYNWWNIGKYLIFLFLFGLFMNLASNYLYNYVSHLDLSNLYTWKANILDNKNDKNTGRK